MIGAGLLWTSSSRFTALFFQYLNDVVALVSLVFWILFVITYTGQRDRFTGWRGAVVFGGPVIALVRTALIPVFGVIWDNYRLVDFQGLTLVARDVNLEVLFYLALMYPALLWTFVVLWRFYRSEVAGQRRQAGIIFLAAIAPAVAAIGYNPGGLSVYEHLDPTPLFFGITVVGTWIALFQYDFLDVHPVTANTLFETMADPVIIIGRDGTVRNVNEAATSLPVSTGEQLAGPLATAMEEDASEVRLETTNGTERVFDLSLSSLTDGQDRQRGRLLVLREITLRTRRERELKRQNERLDEFAGVVSHDLRNPLAVAEGNLSLIEETGELDRADKVRRSLDRIGTIIENLLEMARAGDSIESTEPVSLAGVAHEAWQQVRAEDSTLDVRADVTIDADHHRLTQLFENLFRNAIEHNESPVTIRVETLGGDRTGGFVVSDDGAGIPPAERDEVFDHGYTTNTDGTGFGLSIVEDIVTAHGWEIAVTESERGGARFEITGCVTAAMPASRQ